MNVFEIYVFKILEVFFSWFNLGNVIKDFSWF